MGTYNEIKISIRNKLTKAVYTDLATATEIKVQFKESISEAPIIAKNLAGGDIAVNTPATGDATVKLNEADFVSTILPGNKFFAVQVTDALGRPVNVEPLYLGRVLETIEFKANPVT
jgi:hypothetical protein